MNLEDYKFSSFLLSSFKPDYSSLIYDDILALIRFLEILWLKTNNLSWDREEQTAKTICDIGKLILTIIGKLLETFPNTKDIMEDPKKFKNIEKHLFELCTVCTSPISFLERRNKVESRSKKLQRDTITKLMSQFLNNNDSLVIRKENQGSSSGLFTESLCKTAIRDKKKKLQASNKK